MSPLKRKERNWKINNEYVLDASDSREEEQHEEPQIRNILVELSKKIPSQKDIDLHILETSKNILFWTPKGEMVYQDRRIPVTNIAQLIEYVLLPYSQDVVKPWAINTFLKWLAELKIDKSLIKSKKLVMSIIEREKEKNIDLESLILVAVRVRKIQVRLRIKQIKARWETNDTITGKTGENRRMRTKAQNKKQTILTPAAKITWHTHLFKPVLILNGRAQLKVLWFSIKH